MSMPTHTPTSRSIPAVNHTNNTNQLSSQPRHIVPPSPLSAVVENTASTLRSGWETQGVLDPLRETIKATMDRALVEDLHRQGLDILMYWSRQLASQMVLQPRAGGVASQLSARPTTLIEIPMPLRIRSAEGEEREESGGRGSGNAAAFMANAAAVMGNAAASRSNETITPETFLPAIPPTSHIYTIQELVAMILEHAALLKRGDIVNGPRSVVYAYDREVSTRPFRAMVVIQHEDHHIYISDTDMKGKPLMLVEGPAEASEREALEALLRKIQVLIHTVMSGRMGKD